MRKNLYPSVIYKQIFSVNNGMRVLLVRMMFILISFSSAIIVNAQSGEALNFAGDNDYVALPVAVNGSYTKEAWINPSNTSGFPNLISGSATALFINNGFLAAGHAPLFNDLIDPTPLLEGVWQHVAVTYNAGTGLMTLYKNGISVASATNLAPFTETPLELGRFNFGAFFQGSMDEVRLWNIERTSAEILANIACEVRDDAPGLIAYYRFNQGTAGGDNTGVTTLEDSHDACTPSNGTLSGFSLTPGIISNWIAPGAITIPCFPAENIRVLGPSLTCIDDGDLTPDGADGTDFGDIGADGISRIFTIVNSGNSNLTITSTSSSNPTDFTITNLPAGTVAPGDSTTFTVTFNPSASLGNKTAVITINNSDSDEGVYDFAVQGNNAGAGQALDFDGSDDFVDVPVIVSGDYTKEVWFRPTNVIGFPQLISGTGTALFIRNGELVAGHALSFDQTAGGVIAPGVWHHAAVTYNATTELMSLYLNGVLISTGTAPAYTETNLDLGIFNSGFYFQGQMDEVRLWDIERSGADILANMSCELRGDEPGLIAYYNFNQGIAGGNNPGETVLRDVKDTCTPANGTLVLFALTGSFSNWVQPGAVTGTCGGPVPNIRIISGLNDACILDGDNTPETADGTDFGFYSDPGVFRVFTITNNGSANLNISAINITGPDASWFTVVTPPAVTSLAPGASTSFTIRFAGVGLGIRTATVSIINDDGDEASYDFSVQGEGTVTVPVSLLSFTGSLNDKVVKLAWSTEGEMNNRGFEIFRAGGQQDDWRNIGFVRGTGRSANEYTFIDHAPMPGVNTYKLKQIDNNGTFRYSNIVAINNTLSNTAVIKSYPNPFTDKIRIVFNDASLLNSKIEIISVSGRRMKSLMLANYNMEIDLSDLPRGIYILRLLTGENIKLIKH